MDNVQLDLSQLIADYVIPFGTKLLGAIVILIIGWMIIGVISSIVRKLLNKNNVDKTLQPVISSTISILLKVGLLLAVAATLGIKTTSFIAILGGFSLAAGLAFQGSLGNLAGGLLLLLFRPIKIDDYVKAQGEEGFVKEIQLFTTILRTADNQTVYLPNGALSSGKITNVSENGTVRLHLSVGIGYGEDIQAARKVLLNVMNQHNLVLKDPAPTVGVVNLGDNSVDLDLRPWCRPGDAAAVSGAIIEQAKIALDQAGIDLPYPQRVVHMVK